MAGADPNNCSGADCSVTIEADITPVIVNIDGLTFSGENVLAATFASPQFALKITARRRSQPCPACLPRDLGMGGRSVREQLSRAMADADRATVRLQRSPRDGDPVVSIGFAMGTNTFDQGPKDGSLSADGYYHPEDEVFLPWLMRNRANTVSEPTQTASANIRRYTLRGDLNPFHGFRQPSTGCN